MKKHDAQWEQVEEKGWVRGSGNHREYLPHSSEEFEGGPVRAKALQSRPTLSSLLDYSPPGSSVHGILRARTLEWVAMPLSKPQGVAPQFFFQINRPGKMKQEYWSGLPFSPPGDSS